ncbi:hypothetical protein V8C42DRAFT_346709 [Trichoderma barbatum]
MPDSSTRACNGSNVGNDAATTGGGSSPSAADYERSYMLNRFLTDQDPAPWHGSLAQSLAEVEARVGQELRKFDDKYLSSNDTQHRG